MGKIMIRKNEFVDEKGVVRKKDMMTINQIEKYLLNKTFEKTSSFYVGNISLGSQVIMVNVPTHQKILITKVGNGKMQYKMLKIRALEDSLEFYYNGYFEQLIENNPSKKQELLKIKSDQRKEFMKNSKERLNGAVGLTYHFIYAQKRVLVNFMEGLN